MLAGRSAGDYFVHSWSPWLAPRRRSVRRRLNQLHTYRLKHPRLSQPPESCKVRGLPPGSSCLLASRMRRSYRNVGRLGDGHEGRILLRVSSDAIVADGRTGARPTEIRTNPSTLPAKRSLG